ncbi:MAG: DNA internalization-related competence protein ComEC/Rec2 [Gemmatimonas sp.]
MPLLVYAVASWLIGLFAATQWGLSLTPKGVVVCAVTALAIAWITFSFLRSATFGVVTIVCCAAYVVGSAHAQRKAACLDSLASSEAALEIAVDARATPRAFVRGEARGRTPVGECAVNATLKVTEGSAPPGNIATFTGTRTSSPRGLQLEGTVAAGTKQSILRAWRGRAGESLDTLFGPRAALARALLIADQDGIEPAVRDKFADAGLIHILSISGLHVALIAGALTVIASAMRLPRGPAALGSLVLVMLYVLALGAPAPAVRSAIMLATGTVVARLQRPVHPWTALALGAAIPTFRPDVVIDLGWQLSVSGMASLLAARAIMRRARDSSPPIPLPHHSRWRKRRQRSLRALSAWFRGLDGWRWSLSRELITGTLASLVTAPIVAWYFGRISIVAPISNIFASPVIAFLQPALFLALVLAPFRGLAQIAADACVAPLALLDVIATYASAVPHAALRVAPTLVTAVCMGVAMAAVVRGTVARAPARYIIVAAVAVCVAVWAPVVSRGTGQAELHMIDVGQGDAIAIRTPKGRWILIDAGRSWNGGDAGRRVVIPYVRRLGGDIAAFILSHPHDDHVGGAASVVKALNPAVWWEPAYVGTSPTYRSALLAVRQQQVPWHRVHPGDTMRIDGVLVRAFAPDSVWTSAQTDPNLASVVVAVEYGSVRWLFTGDAETEEEEWLVERWGNALRSSVLKAGHHGSKTSSSPRFLDAVQPAVALVSVGADNTYGHPSPSTLVQFDRRGIRVVRTDEEGAIVVRTDGTRQEVETRHGKWPVPVR